MRRGIALILCLTMVLWVFPTALAEHNNAGYRMTVGNPDPTPTDEPDIPDSDRPVFHAGGDPAPVLARVIAFEGSYPRLSPADQSGLGMGEWIGYFNGVVEYMAPQFGSLTGDDPLYRVNSGDDGNCQTPMQKLDTGADPTNPNDDPCSGAGHEWQFDFQTANFVQQHHADPVSPVISGGDPLSGFLLPAMYDFYVYFFGEGSSETRPGVGTLDYLDEDLCDKHLAKLGITNNLADCTLITPDDLNGHLGLTDANGQAQDAAICQFAPRFFQVGGGDEPPTCQNFVDNFYDESGQTGYITNKPGWYGGLWFIDYMGSTITAENVVVKEGVRQDISGTGHFHFYVNPVRPDAALRCASPPISTDAPDSLDTGTVFDEETGRWSDATFDYLVEAHDVDMYTGVKDLGGTINDAVDEANRVIGEVLDEIPNLPPEVGQLIDDTIDDAQSAVDTLLETTDPIADAANEFSGRAFPYTLNRAEPNHNLDDSYAYSTSASVQLGVCDGGLHDPAEVDGVDTNYFNYVQADYTTGQVFNGLVLHDYTELDGEGLPRDSNEQGWNPWNPNTYTFDGEILGFLDHNPNGQLDACPSGGNQIGAGQDLCVAQIRWDVNNPDSEIQEAKTETWAPANGFDDFTGLYFTLKLTGPVATYDLENTPDEDQATFLDRTRVLSSDGQNCIVGISKGLLDDPATDARFRTLIGAGSGAQGPNAGPITDVLCEGADGDVAFISDAFFDQGSAGDFDAAFEWVKLSATPEATHPDIGDGLTFNAVITVAETGDTLTAGNLDLSNAEPGAPTLEKIWSEEDGDMTFVWTDHDAFESTPDNAE